MTRCVFVSLKHRFITALSSQTLVRTKDNRRKVAERDNALFGAGEGQPRTAGVSVGVGATLCDHVDRVGAVVRLPDLGDSDLRGGLVGARGGIGDKGSRHCGGCFGCGHVGLLPIRLGCGCF